MWYDNHITTTADTTASFVEHQNNLLAQLEGQPHVLRSPVFDIPAQGGEYVLFDLDADQELAIPFAPLIYTRAAIEPGEVVVQAELIDISTGEVLAAGPVATTGGRVTSLTVVSPQPVFNLLDGLLLRLENAELATQLELQVLLPVIRLDAGVE